MPYVFLYVLSSSVLASVCFAGSVISLIFYILLSRTVVPCGMLCCVSLFVSHTNRQTHTAVAYLVCKYERFVSSREIDSFIFLQFYPICNSESLYARKTAGDPGNAEACNRITSVCRGVWRLAELDMKECWRLCRSNVVNGKQRQSIQNDAGE